MAKKKSYIQFSGGRCKVEARFFKSIVDSVANKIFRRFHTVTIYSILENGSIFAHSLATRRKRHFRTKWKRRTVKMEASSFKISPDLFSCDVSLFTNITTARTFSVRISMRDTVQVKKYFRIFRYYMIPNKPSLHFETWNRDSQVRVRSNPRNESKKKFRQFFHCRCSRYSYAPPCK